MPDNLSPLSAEQTVRREWPLLRARLLDAAAMLDRLEAAGADQQVAEAESLLGVLLEAAEAPRAERLLFRLSRPYTPDWRERFAAGEAAID